MIWGQGPEPWGGSHEGGKAFEHSKMGGIGEGELQNISVECNNRCLRGKIENSPQRLLLNNTSQLRSVLHAHTHSEWELNAQASAVGPKGEDRG